MIENTRLWDVGFIRSLVNAEDAAKILKTLNLESIHHDKLSWNHEKNGVYSVQSGYCLSLHHQNTSFGEYAGIVYLRGCASIIVVLTVHITVFCVIQVQRTAFTYFSIAQIRQHMGLWSWISQGLIGMEGISDIMFNILQLPNAELILFGEMSADYVWLFVNG